MKPVMTNVPLPSRSQRTEYQLLPRLVKLGPLRLVVVQPHGWSYGHAAMDLMTAMALARRHRATLVVFKPRSAVVRAPLLFRAAGIREIMLPVWLLAPMTRLKGLLRAAGRVLRRAGRGVRDAAIVSQPSRAAALQFHRRLVLEPLDVRLPDSVERWARQRAESLGLDVDRPFVCVHAREAGFKTVVGGSAELSANAIRNVEIDSYREAIDHLAAEGLGVVRIGDPTMKPFDHPGVIDAATAAGWDPRFDVWLLAHCAFLIGCDSGPYAVTNLTGTPVVITNTVDPIASYPLRAPSVYLLKHVVSEADGIELGLEGILSGDYLANERGGALYSYRDNSPAEILAATLEVEEALRSDAEESQAQQAYRRAATEASETLASSVPMVAKWGSDAGFLGEGRLARSYLEGASGAERGKATNG